MLYKAFSRNSLGYGRSWLGSLGNVHSRQLTSGGDRLVLGIESSCDDSCAALVSAPVSYPNGNQQDRATIHTSIVKKQDHGITKGIEPLTAAHHHASTLPIAILEALKVAEKENVIKDYQNPIEIDAIAVTQGPGMASSLSQGLGNAKLLATLWSKPLVYCHHMVAHTLTPLLTNPPGFENIKLPFLVLLLSGGHTQLVLCKSYESFNILVNSNDDSIGDALDKAARDLQVPFDWSKMAPGAALEEFARPERASLFPMPIPVRGKAEFSYSGIKSALYRLIKANQDLLQNEDDRRAIAYSFQRAAFAQIQDKLEMIFSARRKSQNKILPDDVDSKEICDLDVSGGVASNHYLRDALQSTLEQVERADIRLHFPPISLCTDNAAMIAHAALIRWDPTNDLTFNPRARWSVEDYP